MSDVTILSTRELAHETSRRGSTGEALGEVANLSVLAGLTHLRVHHEVLPPGRRSSPAHSHSAREEVVYVVSGTPTVWVGEEPRVLAPGDFVALAPSDRPHCIENTSGEDAVLFVASATPGEDVVTFADGG